MLFISHAACPSWCLSMCRLLRMSSYYVLYSVIRLLSQSDTTNASVSNQQIWVNHLPSRRTSTNSGKLLRNSRPGHLIEQKGDAVRSEYFKATTQLITNSNTSSQPSTIRVVQGRQHSSLRVAAAPKLQCASTHGGTTCPTPLVLTQFFFNSGESCSNLRCSSRLRATPKTNEAAVEEQR